MKTFSSPKHLLLATVAVGLLALPAVSSANDSIVRMLESLGNNALKRNMPQQQEVRYEDERYDKRKDKYRKEEYRKEEYRRESYREESMAASVQRALARQGYYRGAVDGAIGQQSRNAIANYQRDNNLAVTGNINSGLVRALGLQ